MHVDAVSFRPVEVFLNGDFWGIHNVREKVDRYYIQYNFGVDDDSLDILEEQDQMMEGDFVLFDEMEATVLGMDLSDDSDFAIADSLFDVLNMADYYICQTYLNNLDWPYNNLKFWRERRIGAKWRYIIFDLDATLGGVSFAPVELDNLARALGSFGDDNRHVLIFRKLLENETYSQYFINRYCDLMNTTFSATRFSDHLIKEYTRIEPLASKHFNRWEGGAENWYDELDVVNEYINGRPPYAIGHVQDYFGLSKQADVHLNVYPPKAGRIGLNSLSLKAFPFEGIYFEDVPISLNVSENPGFRFSHWETNHGDLNANSASLSFQPTDGDTLTAIFTGNATYTPFDVYPNPANESVSVSFILSNKQKVGIFLIDPDGRTEHRLYADVLHGGTHELQIDLPKKLSGVFLLTLLTEDERHTEPIMLLKSD